MIPDQFDNNNNDKVREITQDRRNASSNMARKQEPASLSFDFDKKPEEPDGLSFEFENKPSASEQKKVPETVPSKSPATEAPKKQYGLPADYSRPQTPKPVRATAPKNQSQFSKKYGSAKTALKKK